jgi:hypothetical protein
MKTFFYNTVCCGKEIIRNVKLLPVTFVVCSENVMGVFYLDIVCCVDKIYGPMRYFDVSVFTDFEAISD